MSIIDPLTCGFAKIAAYDLITTGTNLKRQDGEKFSEFTSREYKFKFGKFKDIFKDNNTYEPTYQHYTTNFNKIKLVVQNLNKKDSEMKAEVCKVFSPKNWEKLSKEKLPQFIQLSRLFIE